MKRMIVGYVPTKWYSNGWSGRGFSGKVTARRAIYKDVGLSALEKNRRHNREVAKSFNTESSMSKGRYNPLTKQV